MSITEAYIIIIVGAMFVIVTPLIFIIFLMMVSKQNYGAKHSLIKENAVVHSKKQTKNDYYATFINEKGRKLKLKFVSKEHFEKIKQQEKVIISYQKNKCLGIKKINE